MKAMRDRRFSFVTWLRYNGAMKRTVCLAAFCVAASALGMIAGPVALGVSPFADTEASTNMPLPACAGAQGASFVVSSTQEGFKVFVR